MNQILFNKKIKTRIKKFFKIQMILSVILGIIFSVIIINNKLKNSKLENISHVISKKIKLEGIYNVKPISNNSFYFGKIYIEKINLEYIIFNEINENLLKIAPCKFYGSNLGKRGDICIAGHNYNDDSFFSRIDELEINDFVVLEDLEKNKYIYKIFDIYETDENDMSILVSNKQYELTLLTCDNSNKKRIIV